MKLYKLTDAEGRTYNNTQWGEGVTHNATGRGRGRGSLKLCSTGFIHAYESPEIAVLFNPIHSDFRDPMLLWEAEGEIALKADQTKCGCKSLTTLRTIACPVIFTEQRVRFAILCATSVYQDPEFLKWSKRWLSGKDRSSAADCAASAAVWAASAAAWAASAAAWAASAEWAASAADCAASAAAWAASAAVWAASAADCAVLVKPDLDLIALISEALAAE
jgi:hypothetical protein